MKIGFDAKRLFHNRTGLGNYSRTLVRNVQAFYPEHEYHLFTPTIEYNPETAYFLDSGKFVIHTSDGNASWWRSMSVSDEIESAGIDIYHGLSHEIPFSLPGKNVVSLISFHDLIYKKFPGQYPVWDRWMYNLKYKFSARAADHIIAISKSTQNDLMNMYYIPRDRISVVYQSCGAAFQNAEPLSAGSKPEDYFLYVGSIIERKGLLKIVEAYKDLPEELRIPCKVVGNGKKYLGKVRNAIDQYQLQSYFEFVSTVDNHALLPLYQDAIATLLPSVYEGFGIPVIESLFVGTPVITSKVSSLPEAAGPGAILINPDSAEELKSAMIEMMVNKERRHKLSKEGGQYVDTHFSAFATAKALMEVYKNLIKTRTS